MILATVALFIALASNPLPTTFSRHARKAVHTSIIKAPKRLKGILLTRRRR